jgi:hypothetical protein
MPEVKFIFGIDPGATTGIALFDVEKGCIDNVFTSDFWGTYKTFAARALAKAGVKDCLVIIEAPVKNAMYAKQQAVADQGSAKRANRMMSNAASNAREAELLADGIEALGYTVKRVRPSRTKLNAEECRAESGFEGSTNQHTRDAIMLCYHF